MYLVIISLSNVSREGFTNDAMVTSNFSQFNINILIVEEKRGSVSLYDIRDITIVFCFLF